MGTFAGSRIEAKNMASTSSKTAYPLAWPDEWPRTKYPASSKFNTSLSAALENVRSSLSKFAKDSGKQVTDILISSNVTLGDQHPRDAGVAIYFTWDELATCIAVDRYTKVEDNLQAIHHVIEAERTKLRHGGLNLVRAAFRGYAKLPPPQKQTAQPWNMILGVPENAPLDAIESAYKRLRSSTHPDKGGSPEAFNNVQRAYDQAIRARGN
jgi:hypothetical protein